MQLKGEGREVILDIGDVSGGHCQAAYSALTVDAWRGALGRHSEREASLKFPSLYLGLTSHLALDEDLVAFVSLLCLASLRLKLPMGKYMVKVEPPHSSLRIYHELLNTRCTST